MAQETKSAAKSNERGGNKSALVTALKGTQYSTYIQVSSLSLLALIAVKGMVTLYIFLAAGLMTGSLAFDKWRKVQAPGISEDQSGGGREGPQQSNSASEKANREPSQSTTPYTSAIYVHCIIFLFIVAVAIAQYKRAQSEQHCNTEEFPHSEYPFAIRTKGMCVPRVARSKVESALDQYVDFRLTEAVCAVLCTRLTRVGNWEGYVAFGAETYDWEEWMERCSSVGKRGECAKKREELFASDAGEL